MLRSLGFLNGVIAAVGLLYQTYNGDIHPNGCVDPLGGTTVTNTMPPIINYTMSAPIITEPNHVAIRQLAFQWFGNSYTQPVVTLNGIAATSSPHCCAPTGCDAAVHYTPWNEAECGLTWCGTSNQWIYLDFSTTSLHSVGMVQGDILILQFTNPQNIVDNNGEPIFALSYDLVPIPSTTVTVSQTPSITLTSSASNSVSETSSMSLTLSETPSTTLTSSASSSLSRSASETPSTTLTSMTLSPSQTSSTTLSPSETAAPSRTASPSRTQSPTPVSSFFPSPSPTGICYSVSTQFGTTVILSGGWIIVATGINVTQAYGSGYISMGTFAGCSVIGSTCKCSYTGGSTVAGCGGKRNSYITYSYGSTTGITYVNESPTCSYNFAGTIGLVSRSTSVSPSKSSSTSQTASLSNSKTISTSASVSYTASVSATGSVSRSVSDSVTPTASVKGSLCDQLPTLVYGEYNTVIGGGVTYYINHGSTITHKLLSNTAMFIGSLASCLSVSTGCICSYGPGSSVGCPSARQGYINYTIGFPVGTTFYSQYPICQYYFNTQLSYQTVQMTASYSTSRSTSVTPSITSSTSSSASSSITASVSDSYSISASLTPSLMASTSLTSSSSASISVTPSLSSSSSLTPSLTASTSYTASLSDSTTPSFSLSVSTSLSYSPSSSFSGSTTLTASSSGSVSPTVSSSVSSFSTTSSSPSFSASTTLTASSSGSTTPTISLTGSRFSTSSLTKSITSTRSTTLSSSNSYSQTITPTNTISINLSQTSTPLYYITAYASSSATEGPSSTSTPLYQITPYPSNGSYTATSTPLFMMIPYPSSSPIVNYTYTTLPDSAGTIVAGVGVAVLGTTFAVVGVFQFMKPKIPPVPSLPVEEEQQQQQQQQRDEEEEKTHIVISTSDKNEIMKLLQDHQKDFSVL